MEPPGLAGLRRRALDRLVAARGVVVALSGGVDSAVLLALAVEALGAPSVVAATGVSASLSASELGDARRIAGFVGVRHRILATGEIERPGYRANDGTRCFHCRDELFGRLRRLADEQRLPHVAYGAITDDLGDDRPGMRAARRHGVLAPLLEAGFSKADVREVARAAALPVHDKPAAACLASRIPTGTEVTRDKLGQIERAEAALRGLGFGQLRVRHHGDVARLELDADGDRRLASDPGLRAEVVLEVRAAGFRFVALDLEGYRTGSLNVVGRAGGGAPTRPKLPGGQ